MVQRTHHRDAQVRVVGTADDERLSWGMEDRRALNAELLGHLGGRVDEYRGVVQLERAMSLQEGRHGFLYTQRNLDGALCLVLG